MSTPEVRPRADRRAAEARPGSAPVWDTRGGLVPGPDRDKRGAAEEAGGRQLAGAGAMRMGQRILFEGRCGGCE